MATQMHATETIFKPGDSYVQSFARGLTVIRAFGQNTPRMTLSQVAARTGLTRAGARRILLTLENLGYVAAEEKKFFLTPKILDLGYAYLSTAPFWIPAESVMEQLVSEVHESCSISVLDGTEIVYVARVPTSKIMTMNLGTGSRLPAYATSMGRVLLGAVPDTKLKCVLAASHIEQHTKYTITDAKKLMSIVGTDRDRGWSYVNQELEEGLRSIAVPLKDRTGKTIAAMNISGQANRNSEKMMTVEFLPKLKQAAERINTALRMRSGV
jgi:IclR family transcriptional regulator, pca regulon regulatory protein